MPVRCRRSHRWPSWLAFVVIGAAKSADVRGAPGVSMKTFAILNFAEAAIAQLGERQTEDLKVPGSIPGLGAPPWALKRRSGLTSRPAPRNLEVLVLSLTPLFWQKKFITSRDSSAGRASD